MSELKNWSQRKTLIKQSESKTSPSKFPRVIENERAVTKSEITGRRDEQQTSVINRLDVNEN